MVVLGVQATLPDITLYWGNEVPEMEPKIGMSFTIGIIY